LSYVLNPLLMYSWLLLLLNRVPRKFGSLGNVRKGC